MKKRHVMRALVAAATALALTACGSTGSSDTSKSTSTASAASTSSGSEAGTENTITIPAGESVSQDSDVTAMVAVDFTTMDPMDTSDTLSGGVQRMMMDGLFGFDERTPWNADALIANVNKWADKSLGLKRTTFLCNVLDHAEKIDDYTVKIYLSQSFGAFISNLAHPATLIMSPKQIEAGEDACAQAPVGTGQYKFVEWVAGDHMKVELNKDWWGYDADVCGGTALADADAGFKSITFKPVAESATRVSAIQAGDAQIMWSVPTESVDTLKGDSNVFVGMGDSIAVWYFFMNTQKAPFNDVKVREAMAYAINKEAYIQVVMNGYGSVGLIFAADLGEEGLGNLCGVRALVDHYEKNLCGMAAFDLYRDKMYPICIGSVRYRISAKTKGGHSFLNFGRKNAIAELAGLIGELYRFQTDAASHTTYNVGKIEGGTSVNTIAQDASMLFEFRSEDYRSLEACETYLEQTIAARQSEEVQYSCELVGKRPCARETDPVQMARMTRCAQKTLKAADGEEPVCSEASTDCNIPLSRHIPAICVGFCRGGGAHTREEWLDAASVEDGMCAAVALVCRLPWMCCESRVVVRDGIEDRKEKEEIRQLLELCDQDFVPPLSHRNSTSQTNWAETEEKTDGIAEYLENICSQHVVLWKEEGVVRAFMTWKDHFNCENLEAYPDSCYLTTLCVWPDYRGQGISEVMYAEAEKDIAAKFPGSRITLRTWSTNGAQEHILDKLGYSLVRRLKDDRGEGIDTVYFVKKEENDR